MNETKLRNQTRKGIPLRRPEIRGFATSEGDDEMDYRDSANFVFFENVFRAFLLSQWDQGFEVSVGTAGRSFGFTQYVNDAIEMLKAVKFLELMDKGSRTFIIRGPGLPAPVPCLPYGTLPVKREILFTGEWGIA